MTETIKQQILMIRNTGLTNMFDIKVVSQLAEEFDFPELLEFLDNHRSEYVQFILTGQG